MKVIGLTGGIGSGKSTVSKVFESLGIPVFNSDAAGRRILDEDLNVREAVTNLLGEKVYRNGKADRPAIASIVFNDANKLKELNAIIHPAVARLMSTWVASQIGVAYCMKEAAILYESGADAQCDEVVCVVADENLRVNRIMQREGVKKAEVLARMEKQWPQQEKAERSRYVIENDGNTSVIQQVLRIHQELTS